MNRFRINSADPLRVVGDAGQRLTVLERLLNAADPKLVGIGDFFIAGALGLLEFEQVLRANAFLNQLVDLVLRAGNEFVDVIRRAREADGQGVLLVRLFVHRCVDVGAVHAAFFLTQTLDQADVERVRDGAQSQGVVLAVRRGAAEHQAHLCEGFGAFGQLNRAVAEIKPLAGVACGVGLRQIAR